MTITILNIKMKNLLFFFMWKLKKKNKKKTLQIVFLGLWHPCAAPCCVDSWQGACCLCGGFKSVIGLFNQLESMLSQEPAPSVKSATEPLPWVSHYRPSISRGILLQLEPSQSASQQRSGSETTCRWHHFIPQTWEAYPRVMTALLKSYLHFRYLLYNPCGVFSYGFNE